MTGVYELIQQSNGFSDGHNTDRWRGGGFQGHMGGGGGNDGIGGGGRERGGGKEECLTAAPHRSISALSCPTLTHTY